MVDDYIAGYLLLIQHATPICSLCVCEYCHNWLLKLRMGY